MTTNPVQRLARIPSVTWVLALTLACLAPFINKAYHIDDTLFLWVGQHIQKHPADPFGFTVNWFGFSYPMVKCFENPPLACYYLALAASIAGWREWALHAAFLLPALAGAWGIHSLAQRYCQTPLLAAAVAVLTPVLLISSTTLMCDVMLLAFWVWSMVLFEKGQDERSPALFLASGLVAGLAALTKFPGLALVPLFIVCGYYRQRRIGWWLAAPAIPLLCAGAYELWSRWKYGQGLLFAAATYASGEHHATEGLLPERLLVGLEFMGGCFLPSLFFAPVLWSRRTILVALLCFAPFIVLLPEVGPIESLLWWQGDKFDWTSFVQSALFTLAGVHLLILAGTDFWSRRDSTSLCLALWTAGIFVFAAAVNWTLNGRSFLPMTPAVGILVARRLDRRYPGAKSEMNWRFLWPAIPAAALSLALVKADYDLAGVNRTAANELCARYRVAGRTLWFRGHWGFQYYMERLGAKPLDTLRTALSPGDRVILPDPRTASNVFDVPSDVVRLLEVLEFIPNRHYATMSVSAAAGFYTSRNGLLPFAAGKIDPMRFYVFEAIDSLDGTIHFADHHSSAGAWEQQHALEAETIACQSVIARNPSDPQSHFQLGLVWLGRAEPRKAAKEFAEVLRLAPDSVEALNNLAWILATDPDQRFRDGQKAVQLAERAGALTGRTNAFVIGTLAASYAEAGRFNDAVAAASRAIQIAERSADNQALAVTNRQLLELYKAKRPYHQQ